MTPLLQRRLSDAVAVARTLRHVHRVAALVKTLPARHAEASIIASVDDLPGQPTPALLRLGLEAARVAVDVDLSDVAARCKRETEAVLVRQWPGEHYRLLGALVRVVRPTRVVEIGTATGLSALSLLTDPQVVVTSYDVIPWHRFPNTALCEEDFAGRLEQRLGDLGETEFFEREVSTLRKAEIVFLDGPKDGVFEPTLLRRLLPALADRRCVLVLDDIRLPNMVPLWRRIEQPALDMTSFGHWSGTGLVLTGEWT